MTTPIIPDFILKLFQNEINTINNNLLNNFCKLFKIDLEDAKNKLKNELNISLEIDKNEKIKIVKKHKDAPQEERCCARVYRQKDLEVGQCPRKHANDCGDFCKRHKKMHDEGRLKYGTINQTIPKEISPEVLNKKKKITLL